MKASTLLLPIAGRSSRYLGMRPKWLLTHPRGTLMLTEAIRGLDPKQFSEIVIVALKAHEEDYHFSAPILEEVEREYGISCNNVKIILLEKETASQPETVYQGIQRANIVGKIFIKDSDNYFLLKDVDYNNNFVTVIDLHDTGPILAGNKSYARLDDNGFIVDIKEKKIISDLFCCGGYYFTRAADFCEYYKLLAHEASLYISHIIHLMLKNGYLFGTQKGSFFEDWGTLNDWISYKNRYTTLFVELDGIIVLNSTEHFEPRWGSTEALRRNVSKINELYESGQVEIIIITSRREKYRSITEAQLEKNSVKYHRILMDLNCNSRRALISCFSKDNPYPSGIAINLHRNDDRLDEVIKYLI